jgi:hypothetical protein
LKKNTKHGIVCDFKNLTQNRIKFPEHKKIDIFGCFPTSSTSGGERLCQGGKEKFVTSLAFRRARGDGRNKQA